MTKHYAGIMGNPRRPPRNWWRDCVRGVRDGGGAISPEKVCGALWFRKMTAAKRRAAIRRSER